MKLILKRNSGPIGGFLAELTFVWAIYSYIVNTDVNVLLLYAMLAFSCMYIICFTKGGVKHLKEFMTNKAILVMCIVMLFPSIFVNRSNLIMCIQQIIFMVLTIMLGYLLFRETPKLQGDVFWNRIKFMLFIVALFGVWEYMSGKNIFMDLYNGTFAGMGRSGRVASCFIHSIPYGHVMIYGFCFCIYALEKKVVNTFIAFLFAFSVLVTGSRSAWLVLFFVCVMYAFQNASRKIKKQTFFWIFAIFAGIIAFLFSKQGQELLSWMDARLGSVAVSLSNELRYDVYLQFASIYFKSNIIEVLFGHGMNSLAELLKNLSYLNMAVDNTLLTFLYDFGLISGIATIMLIVVWTKELLSSGGKDKKQQLLPMLLMTNVLMSMFYDSYGWKNVSFLSFVIIGYWMAQRKNVRDVQ